MDQLAVYPPMYYVMVRSMEVLNCCVGNLRWRKLTFSAYIYLKGRYNIGIW